jgi:hypothetical protein
MNLSNNYHIELAYHNTSYVHRPLKHHRKAICLLRTPKGNLAMITILEDLMKQTMEYDRAVQLQARHGKTDLFEVNYSY